VLRYARGAFLPQLVDMIQDLLAQGAKQPALACVGAQVAVADAHGVGLVFDADEAQHARFGDVAHDEPAVAQPVAQGVAATVASHGRAGEKSPHLGEKCGLVVK